MVNTGPLRWLQFSLILVVFWILPPSVTAKIGDQVFCSLTLRALLLVPCTSTPYYFLICWVLYSTCSWCIPAPVLTFIHVTLSHIKHIHFSCCGTLLFLLWVSSLSSWYGTQNFYFLRGSHYSSLFTILDSEDQRSTPRHLVIDSALSSLDSWEETSLASHWMCTRHCDILCTYIHTNGLKSPVIKYLQ